MTPVKNPREIPGKNFGRISKKKIAIVLEENHAEISGKIAKVNPETQDKILKEILGLVLGIFLE